MNFFVIPYLLAVDLIVPPGSFEYGPTYYFNVTVDTTTKLLANTAQRTSYNKLTTVMVCTADSTNYACTFRHTKVIHDQNSKDYSSSLDSEVSDGSMLTGISTITKEGFLLDFDQTGVKIKSIKERSERSLRMIQKIIDLLHVEVDFDGERQGSSRLETITIVDDCPMTTRANYQPIGKSMKKPGQGFFKIVSHPDEFDETSEWILQVNKTKDIKNCKNYEDYFFGSGGENDVMQGSKISSDVISSYNNIEMTNEKFISIGNTEGIVTSGRNKFFNKDRITVSIDLDHVYIPIEWKRYQDKITNRFIV